MKPFRIIVVTIVAGVFCSPLLRAVENPVAGTGRMPVSSTRSGLVRSPNPIDRSSNLVVTGNVGGGRHFRGVVPYNAVTDFGAPTSSSTFDPFLRRSAGSGDFQSYTGRYNPYYSQTKSITTIRPGYSGVFRPPATSTAYQPKRYAAPRIASDTERPVPTTKYRPMAMTQKQIEEIISSEVEKQARRQKQEFIEQHHRAQLEKFKEELEQISDEAQQLEESLTDREEFLKRQKEFLPTLPQQEQIEEPEQIDVFEKMKQQLEEFQAETEEIPADQPQAEQQPTLPEGSQQTDKLAEVALSVAKAQAIRGKYKTFASFSDSKFNKYLKAGEDYLKQGKSYLAADAYTMASVYKPNDPLAYAGKSHALFVAGEYMSSALFLSRALSIFPEYAAFKIDLVLMAGDKDTLENRIVDIKQWLEESKAPELQFLLAYIYYQMDRLKIAQETINAAYGKMPNAKAVLILKTAIDAAVEAQSKAK